MASARKTSTSRSSQFRCPECGFRAAHAMGLGRHRTAKHGVLSQRQRQARSDHSTISRKDYERLRNRVGVLEKQYETLLNTLLAAARSAGKIRTR